MSERAKIDRLTKTMALFFEKRRENRMVWFNGRLPISQRKVMVSLIKQAKKIDETAL